MHKSLLKQTQSISVESPKHPSQKLAKENKDNSFGLHSFLSLLKRLMEHHNSTKIYPHIQENVKLILNLIQLKSEFIINIT